MKNSSNSNFNIILRVILGLSLIIFVSFVLGNNFLKMADSKIKSQDGRVNVLILGKSGAGHAGGDLTDTMILVSLSLNNKSVDLISIPRDIWIPEIRAKINSAYYWGKEKPEFGGGLPFVKEITQKIVGEPINYALVLDFSSFKDIVDALGGVNIDVANSFTDSLYPVVGREEDLCGGDKELKCRYETLHFVQGKQFMDGEMALKYVRSRNGDNNENTDIAREARQQKVISAIKDKFLFFDVLSNPLKLFRLWKIVGSSIETDLDFPKMLTLGRELLTFRGNIHSSTIPDGILISPPKNQTYDYQYVFVPRSGNWDEIQKWIKDLIK